MIFFYFITAIFTIWAGDIDAGYTEYVVFVTDELEMVCNHAGKIGACLAELEGEIVVITSNPFGYIPKGCNQLTHEWWHLMGYKEYEIPTCYPNQDFRTGGNL